jgi:FMN reductase
MTIAIISSSLRKGSFSKIMAQYAAVLMKAKGLKVEFIDLSEIELPHYEGLDAFNDPSVQDIIKRLEGVERILIATPIYNFSVSSVLKNFLELTGRSVWTDKFVGFLCVARGVMGYMAVMPFVNSLMLGFRCIVIPRFVYAQPENFNEGSIVNNDITRRIEGLCDIILRIKIQA